MNQQNNEGNVNPMKTERLSFVIDDAEPRILRWHSQGCRPATDPEIELWNALTAEAKRLDWLERNHTLHNSVAILYVVDGYEVQFSTHDGNNLVAETHGETLRDAIDKCMEEVP
jgi:hypothetical protein